MSLRYVSTRGGVPPCGFEEALFAGLAADGGLYLPERWPRLERDDLATLQGASYQEVAACVLAKPTRTVRWCACGVPASSWCSGAITTVPGHATRSTVCSRLT